MANPIKRHFYNNVHYVIDKENEVVVLLPAFLEQLKSKSLWGKFGFKKIGGSSIGDVLLSDNFKSDFLAFCRMSWISQPILDKKYVDAGQIIEPMVINLVEQISHHKVTTYNPAQYNYDFFAGQDDVLGGLPDGFIESEQRLLEIKTAGEKKYDSWVQYGVPKGYIQQAQLYAYLMNVKKFSIIATFLKEEDYAHPELYPIKERKTKAWHYFTNTKQVEDQIQFVKAWYYKHTSIGISPKYNVKRDFELLEWLECSSLQEWDLLKEKWIAEGKLVE